MKATTEQGATSSPRRRSPRSPWVIAIIVALTLVAIVNVLFIWIAVRGQDPIVDSYVTESR